MNVHRNLGIICVILLCGLLLGSCAADASPSLNSVKKFDAYRLYYAGAEVAGLPLEEILGDPSQNDQRSSCCNFIYGTCELEGEDHPSCVPPIEIQVFSTCRRWASALHRRRFLYAFRGAKAAGGKGGLEGGSPLEVFTGRTTVVIWADNGNILKAAARQLHDVRAAGPQLDLPPPVPGSLWGKLPCQVKPG